MPPTAAAGPRVWGQRQGPATGTAGLQRVWGEGQGRGLGTEPEAPTLGPALSLCPVSLSPLQPQFLHLSALPSQPPQQPPQGHRVPPVPGALLFSNSTSTSPSVRLSHLQTGPITTPPPRQVGETLTKLSGVVR